MTKKSFNNSDLELWLRKNNMTTKEFCKLIDCSTFVTWKIKNGKRVREYTAKKILEITKGEVLANF